jgi:hypothetical protein
LIFTSFKVFRSVVRLERNWSDLRLLRAGLYQINTLSNWSES